jgi:tetratricopeptide (TPR) repeat protein
MTQVLNETQLKRIQAVHKGFLYQHLYAVCMLFSMSTSGINKLVVERDEDIEASTEDGSLYLQVKTRSEPLVPSDVTDVLARFEELQREHAEGRRKGRPSFCIVSNAVLSPSLRKLITEHRLRPTVLTPSERVGPELSLPTPWSDTAAAYSGCVSQAAHLPFGALQPETLVYKLAGIIQQAATGDGLQEFRGPELPSLFEQIIVALQEFPEPPVPYRRHINEPEFESDERVRLIVGFSGAGKSAWAAEGNAQSGRTSIYFDAADFPFAAFVPTLARELAARLKPKHPDEVQRTLLPGNAGRQAIKILDRAVKDHSSQLNIVLDNAHSVDADELASVIGGTDCISWLLLAQPWPGATLVSARLRVDVETLAGWSIDSIGEEFAYSNCNLDPARAERVRALTGGLPIFVVSAAKLAWQSYACDVDRMCSELESATHGEISGQEAILSTVEGQLTERARVTAALLSEIDIPLTTDEMKRVLEHAFETDPAAIAALLRELLQWGVLEKAQSGRVVMHDSFRLIGRRQLPHVDSVLINRARSELVRLLVPTEEIGRFRLFCRLLPQVAKMKELIDIASNESEFFQEYGMAEEFASILAKSLDSPEIDSEARFWAADTLAYWSIQDGRIANAAAMISRMEMLGESFAMEMQDRRALAIKRLLLAGADRDPHAIRAAYEGGQTLIQGDECFGRIFRYDYAICLFNAGRYAEAEGIVEPLMDQYYKVLGIGKNDVNARNIPEIARALGDAADDQGEIKRVADCHDLLGRTLEKQGKPSVLNFFAAHKFYILSRAYTSAVKAAQEMLDVSISTGDYDWPREFLEKSLLPFVKEHKLLDYYVPVHSQYAVVLAYSGHLQQARKVMAQLKNFAEASPQWIAEYQNQVQLIERIGYFRSLERQRPAPALRRKVGRNEPCPCGSGKKYKKCCGG